MSSDEGASGVGSGTARPWIAPRLGPASASSALWRFGEIMGLGCVTSEGNDHGSCVGFCSGASWRGLDSEAGAGEDPSLAWYSHEGPGITSAYGSSQSISVSPTAPVGNPPEQQLVDGAGWRSRLAMTFLNAFCCWSSPFSVKEALSVRAGSQPVVAERPFPPIYLVLQVSLRFASAGLTACEHSVVPRCGAGTESRPRDRSAQDRAPSRAPRAWTLSRHCRRCA